jgi:subtilisin family serine protease
MENTNDKGEGGQAQSGDKWGLAASLEATTNETAGEAAGQEVPGGDTYGISVVQEDVLHDMDPHLQDAVLAHRAGQAPDPALSFTSSDGTTQVDVIAKLENPREAVPGLRVVRKIGQIVTGTADIEKIEEVRRHPNVLSLKQATRIEKHLRFSVHEIEAQPQQLAGGLGSASDGSGVIVGVVDFGCDFRHGNFCNADGTTRLLYLWDQTGDPTALSPGGFGYGREFDAARINQALQAPNPYQGLRYQPAVASHGTHVLDIAAGNGQATGDPGVAPNADLIFVELNAVDYEDEESFGNSRRLLEAVDYIFEKAAALNRPCVVNLSLGTHGGPHDGSTLAEQGLDELLGVPGRAIVISAGNSRTTGGHARGAIAPGQARVLSWLLSPGDQTPNELEVWYDGEDDLAVTLITPGNGRFGPVLPGRTVNLMQQNRRVGRIIHRKGDSNNGDNQIDILLDAGLPAGAWQVELQAVAADRPPVRFHAWIERDDNGQSRFGNADVDPAYTIGSISCGERTIAVGSYNAAVPGLDISPFSSEGPTRREVRKPEVSAPGHGIIAAKARSQGGTQKWGTSMAAPHVAGVVALLMQAAGRTLSNNEIRAAVIGSARANPPVAPGGDSVYGQGRISAAAAVQAVRAAAPQPTGGAAGTTDSGGERHAGGSPDGSLANASLDGLPLIDRAIHLALQQPDGARVRVALEIEIIPGPR